MLNKSVELYTLKISIEDWQKNRQAVYRYLLLENEKEVECYDKRIKLPCFGIEIIREDMDGTNVYAVESDRIECLTTYRYKAVQLLKKLYENSVSPIHLIDIAGPMADELMSDFEERMGSTAVQ